MNEPRQSTRISGDWNQGYIAGRDLYLGDQYVAQETLFFEPDLSDVEPPGWTITPKSRELANALACDRLIVLAGRDLDDKTRVARHVAWLLRQDLPGQVRIREWYRSSDPQKIETAFHGTETTILLLPQVQPHHIGHRLNQLRRRLRSRHNFTIITTESTRAEWGIRNGTSEEELWHEVSWENYYGRRFLAETLLAGLQSLESRRPEWLPKKLEIDTPLAEGIHLEDAAARLKQPDRIMLFVQWLGANEASPREAIAQIDHLGGDQSAIFHWYRQLSTNDQLLALGLVLFDGLPDDQIFAALEILVNEAWRKSDPNLPLFDYKDLDRLSTHFQLAESKEDGTRIEASSRQKRDAILRAAWEAQRRRLLAVLPALTRLLHELSPHRPAPDLETTPRSRGGFRSGNSARTPEPGGDPGMWRLTGGVERELFSSPRRVEQLRRSIVEALSQIGLLSFEAVEAAFLNFASDSTSGFQTIVAKALAAWRGEGHNTILFKVLKAWWEDGCLVPTSKSTARAAENREDAQAVMRVTVAAATAYAVQYDQPNHLDPNLLALLRMLLSDRHPNVRARVIELTLPLATASHFLQLESLLRDQIVGDRDHLYPIAFGISMAYSLRPVETLKIIESWVALSRTHPGESPEADVTPRARILSAAALAYGYIRLDPTQGLLAASDVVEALRSILATEISPFVRTHALMAMGLQAVDNFGLVSSTLLELISEVTLADRLHVISVLTRAYLKQREGLRGGDDEIESEGRIFQTWTRSPRPLTPIEATLFDWVRDERHPVAQQIAIQTFAAIATTDLEQRERDQVGSPPLPTAPPLPSHRIDLQAPKLREAPFLQRAAVFLSTPRRKTTRALLTPIVAEAVEIQRIERTRIFEGVAANASGNPRRAPNPERPSRRHLVPIVLARWQALGEEEIRQLGIALRRALDIFRWRWPIVFATVLSIVLLYRDVTDWRWALGASLSPLDEFSIRSRRSAPLRMAWNLSLPQRQQFLELERAKEEKRLAAEAAAAKRRAEWQSKVDTQAPPPAPPPIAVPKPESTVAVIQPVPRPTLTPQDRLLESAVLQLIRMPDPDSGWLLPVVTEKIMERGSRKRLHPEGDYDER